MGSQPFACARAHLPFRAVNRCGSAGHDPALQRHHLLPLQLLRERSLARMIAALGFERIGFDDFRSNGMLLPAREEAMRRLGLPLHRGPHRAYSAMVLDRVGRVESGWSRRRAGCPRAAGEEALMRLALLQNALRRRLLDERTPVVLNTAHGRRTMPDFADLDAMAEALWAGCAEVERD